VDSRRLQDGDSAESATAHNFDGDMWKDPSWRETRLTFAQREELIDAIAAFGPHEDIA
jgi:hypothetical protein